MFNVHGKIAKNRLDINKDERRNVFPQMKEKKTWLLNCLNVLLCVCYNVDKEGGREEIDSELSANGSPFVLTVVCAQINIFGIF